MTVAVEGVEFKQAVEVGELVTIKASVIFVGKTTMIVGMRIESFKPTEGIARHTNSCYFTMAAKEFYNLIQSKCKVKQRCVY